jgi:hypothetical protein
MPFLNNLPIELTKQGETRWQRATRNSGKFLILLAVELMAGCSTSSVLIKYDDFAFDLAQKKLESTISKVDELKSAAAERTMFLQAESFYRYRFAPPPQSTASFFAQAAASVTDFPAFQALAGSLSLLDLRVRAADSAIQIWETLLLRFPKTVLRPLTLYRLGWAYHNAAAAGLPRENPNDAFDVLIAEYPSSALTSFAKEAEKIDWKSKSSAATRSLIPGFGQIYVGETGSGILRMSVAAASVAAIVVPFLVARNRSNDLNWKRDWPLLATSLGGLIVLSFDYTSAYEDAMRGVVQWNEKLEATFNAAYPKAP